LWPNSGLRKRAVEWGLINNVDPANFPAELPPCIVINAFWGVGYVVLLGAGLIIFIAFWGVLQTLGNAFLGGLGGNAEYIPTLAASYSKLKTAAVEFKKNLSKIANETDKRFTKIKTQLSSQYRKPRNRGVNNNNSTTLKGYDLVQ
jgi:hypothetical protein